MFRDAEKGLAMSMIAILMGLFGAVFLSVSIDTDEESNSDGGEVSL